MPPRSAWATSIAADRGWMRAVVRAVWIAELTDAADVDLDDVRPPSNWIEHHLLAGMLARFRLARLTYPTPPCADSLVSRAIMCLADQGANPNLRVEDLSRALGVSASSLSRVLRSNGLTFLALLHQTRIDAARRLLATSSLSVKEIAHAVGYTSASRLDEHFQRACGITPTAFRASSNRRG